MEAEEWRQIVEFPDYAVSSLGRVTRTTPDRHGRLSRKPLRPVLGNHGYLVVSLHRNAVQSVRMVHRLVCLAFHGEAPEDHFQASHGDGDRLNNRAENLRWASPSANNLDKRGHGTIRCGRDHHALLKPECMPRGSIHGNAKLTEDAVRAIRSDGRSQKMIAAEYGVQQSLISQVKSRKIWAHVA